MANCNHDFAAQMEAIDDGWCPLCLKDAAADLRRQLAGAPEGSPPPGDEARVAEWVMENLERRVEICRLEHTHPHGGTVLVGECIDCHQPYPKWSVDSGMKCPDCKMKSRLASLEEEKAQLEQMLQEGKALVLEGSSLLETTQQRLAQAEAKAFDWQEQWKITSSRLIQAEARAAVMRAWIEDWLDAPFFEGHADWEQWVVPMRQRAHALLSPAAGHALGEESEMPSVSTFDPKRKTIPLYPAAEVKILREVARAASDYIGGSGMTVKNLKRLRDALDKRGEEGEHEQAK